MVLVTSKTSAGLARVGALAPGSGGGERVIDSASFSGAGRAAPQQRTHASRRQQDNPTDPASLCGVYSGGFRRSTGVCVASAGRLVPRGVSGVGQRTTALLRGRSALCECIVTASFSAFPADRGQAAAAVTTRGTDRVITSSEASGTG